MTADEAVRDLIRQALAGAGFSGRGQTWVRVRPELVQVVQVDRAPFGERWSLDLGVAPRSLLPAREPDRTSECPVRVRLEDLPLPLPPEAAELRLGGFRAAVLAGLDLRGELPDRTRLVAAVLRDTMAYLGAIGTVRGLRSRYAAGDFRAGSVDRAAAALLGGT